MSADKPRDMAKWINASAKVALLGQTPVPLRQYSFALDERARRITLKAEVDRPLTEAEREDLEMAESELYAERFFDDEETLIETVIEVVPPPHTLSALQGGVIYNRDAPS